MLASTSFAATQKSCAETRDRTGDLQIFSLTLSQLSYRGFGSEPRRGKCNDSLLPAACRPQLGLLPLLPAVARSRHDCQPSPTPTPSQDGRKQAPGV